MSAQSAFVFLGAVVTLEPCAINSRHGVHRVCSSNGAKASTMATDACMQRICSSNGAKASTKATDTCVQRVCSSNGAKANSA